ncbi:LCP family protein [Bacillus mesophilum]|uniref:Regulatory protein MsrR n=1 Tax=Bacillus mesophilum TaxID=1071718 RepID=A0A7V7UYB4_9BACI|nr:LCP family protein [Bacillus mesophilum]KAB2333542.1 LytR family transcriptional regulator [Bacillus mesophilum]
MKKRVSLLLLITVSILSGCLNADPLAEKESEPINYSSDHKNFLLLGVDSRGEEESRSDAILVARYEPDDHSMKIVSLMRDSYVKIPDYPFEYSKLNHAYYLGGKELLKDTIQENFGIKIDHTAVIDFNGFAAMMDILAPDGIEVEVSQQLIDDMKLDVTPGKQKLNGDQLLSYVRFRHDAKSDFGRVDRQQEVLISIKDQVMKQFTTPEGLVKFPEMLKDVMNYVETDLNFEQAFSIGTSFLLNPITEIETLRVPVADSYENKSYNHAGAVLEMNLEENTEALKQFFNEVKKEEIMKPESNKEEN